MSFYSLCTTTVRIECWRGSATPHGSGYSTGVRKKPGYGEFVDYPTDFGVSAQLCGDPDTCRAVGLCHERCSALYARRRAVLQGHGHGLPFSAPCNAHTQWLFDARRTLTFFSLFSFSIVVIEAYVGVSAQGCAFETPRIASLIFIKSRTYRGHRTGICA